MHLAAIPRGAWDGQVAVCIASGPSLNEHDTAYIHNMRKRDKCRVIAVNNNYIRAPWADHLHACDKNFFDWHMINGAFKTLDIPMITTMSNELSGDMIKMGVKVLLKGQDGGLVMDGDNTIAAGNSSGYQAINIAALYGARRILLIGYDCGATVKDNVCKTHWFGNHPQPTDPSVFTEQLAWYKTMPKALDRHGIGVINCSVETAIDCFPRAHLEDMLY